MHNPWNLTFESRLMSYADKDPLYLSRKAATSVRVQFNCAIPCMVHVDNKTLLVETCKSAKAGGVTSKTSISREFEGCWSLYCRLPVYAYTIYGVENSLLEFVKEDYNSFI